MRCYLIRDGHIFSVEVLDGITSDDEAIELSLKLMQERLDRHQIVHGFEIWDRARFIHRHPPPKYSPDASGPGGGKPHA